MTWSRGSNDEYNRWAHVTGDPSWSWDNLEKYYLKASFTSSLWCIASDIYSPICSLTQNSRLVNPVDNRTTFGQVSPAVHGDGPVEISLQSPLTELDGRIYDTCSLLGDEFPLNIDIQSGNSVGFGMSSSGLNAVN